jgi:hypothetical protein
VSSPVLQTLDSWSATDVTVTEVENALASLRDAAASDDHPPLRTSVMTHLAWVPSEWVDAASATLAGLGERHPSRTILLLPEPQNADRLDADVALECFPLEADRHVCSEVIRLRLCGRRAEAPASIVLPLLISDLPVFLRWRGQPSFDSPEWTQLTGVADRLIVDSREWPDLHESLGRLTDVFDRLAVSDLAWARTFAWRRALAGEWPGIREGRRIAVSGPRADATLLWAWLRARLGNEIGLELEEGDELRGTRIDGRPISAPGGDPLSPSDLLSEELERLERDRIYEDAVRAAL